MHLWYALNFAVLRYLVDGNLFTYTSKYIILISSTNFKQKAKS